MSILIKGIEKPKDCGICPFKRDGWPDEWEMHCKLLGRQVGYFDKKSKVPKDCPIVEVPTPHGRLIDADELYEKTAEWEAQALHMVEETMNDEDKTEWHKWSEVLTERSAFKYDIADAPTIIEAEYNCITDEIAQKIIEEANKACSNCQEWVCDECEYRYWRNKR